MKKCISTVFVIAAFAVSALADGHINSPGATCAAGHINSPGVVCTPPPENGNRAVVATEPTKDDSVLTALGELLSGYNPLGFFFD